MVLSDVHTGHDNTPTEHITNRLKTEITQRFKEQIDYLFITGDFFDQLLHLPSQPTRQIQIFIIWLLRKCKTHSVKLRVLEGTPSHDWKQNYLFTQLNKEAEIEADVRYYPELSIDTEENGLTILYVPDEWDEDNKETQRQVQELLDRHQLLSVDLAMMHGMFHYQVPKHLQTRLPLHDQDYYESVVDQLIIIGHDHKHKRNNKVIVPGSFDRLAHGEEDPKGYLTFEISKTTKPRVTFHENTDAETYLSIHLEDSDVETSLKAIQSTVESLRPQSKVRLVYSSNHAIQTHLTSLANDYPFLQWSKPKVIKDATNETIDTVLTQEYTAIVLNERNIQEKLLLALQERFPQANTAIANQVIEEVLHNV